MGDRIERLKAKEDEMERLLQNKNLNVEALMDGVTGNQRLINQDDTKIEHAHKQEASQFKSVTNGEYIGALNGRKFQAAYWLAIAGAGVVGLTGVGSYYGSVHPDTANTIRATFEIGKGAFDADHHSDKSTKEAILGTARSLEEGPKERLQRIKGLTDELRRKASDVDEARHRAFTEAGNAIANR